MKIRDILYQNQRNEKTAVIYKNHKYSYKRLCHNVTCISYFINKMKKNGQCVAIYIGNSIEFILAYFSIANLNLTPVLIDINTSKQEINSILIQCDIEMVLVSNSSSQSWLNKMGNSEKSSVVNINELWQNVYSQENQECYIKKQNSPQEMALILHTSGSTGAGKNVMFSSSGIISNIEGNIKALRIKETDISLILLPMTYCYCNIAQFLSHMYAGATVVIYENIMRDRYILKTIVDNGCTSVFTVPSLFTEVFYPNLKKVDSIDSLKMITIGGSKISGEIIDMSIATMKNVKIGITYGMTEAGPRISTYFPNGKSYKNCSVGKAIEGCTIEIVNKNEMGVGEVVVSGKSLMLGYYKNYVETKKVLRDGKLHTGDMGYLDDEGNLFLVGRYKNLIISGGRNIVPEEIEEVLEKCSLVKDVLVYGEPNDKLQEVPVAKIVLNDLRIKENTKNVVNELRAFCKNKLDVYKIPQRYYVVDNIKRNQHGKKIRKVQKNGK